MIKTHVSSNALDADAFLGKIARNRVLQGQNNVFDALMDAVFEPVFRAVFFPMGWPVVKLITWGKYPKKGAWFGDTPQSDWTAGVGVAVALIVIMAAARQFVFTGQA